MGMRVTGIEQTAFMLENIVRKTTRKALAAMRSGAKDIRDLAIKQAPVDEGNLEQSITISEDDGGINRRKRMYVFVDEDMAVESRPGATVGDYAAEMHEGTYNLGPLSQEKQDSQSALVGPKFLERAVDELEDEIVGEIEAAIKGLL